MSPFHGLLISTKHVSTEDADPPFAQAAYAQASHAKGEPEFDLVAPIATAVPSAPAYEPTGIPQGSSVVTPTGRPSAKIVGANTTSTTTTTTYPAPPQQQPAVSPILVVGAGAYGRYVASDV